jgi:hypothetical protein
MLNTMTVFSNRVRLNRGFLFGLLIVTALLAFEFFNYSTTEFALSDLLGELSFMGIRWATILAIAFCGIDFAGIARLFTPEQGADEPAEVWYLFGAWMLAATMNAMLTWWGVSIALLNHQSLGNAVVERDVLLKVVPIFVAVMVWLIRVLIIGTISVAGDRLFSQAELRGTTRRTVTRSAAKKRSTTRSQPKPYGSRTTVSRGVTAAPAAKRSYRPAPKPEPVYEPEYGYGARENVYQPVSFGSTRNQGQGSTTRF